MNVCCSWQCSPNQCWKQFSVILHEFSDSDNLLTFKLNLFSEGDPTCQSNINASGFIGSNDCGLKQDIISMSCSVNFKGNVPPKLQWMRINGSNSFAINESLLTCSSSDPIGSITCNYTAASDIDFDGSHFACQTNASRNALHRCSTQVVKIYCK